MGVKSILEIFLSKNFVKKIDLVKILKMHMGINRIIHIMVFQIKQIVYFSPLRLTKKFLPNFRKSRVRAWKNRKITLITRLLTKIRNSDYKLVKKYFCENILLEIRNFEQNFQLSKNFENLIVGIWNSGRCPRKQRNFAYL